MTTLLQTRLPREKADKFRAVAKAEGKSIYQALRELAENYAAKGGVKRFACLDYVERFELPSEGRTKEEVKLRIRRTHEKHR
jgi:hypothetical protein